MLNKEQILKADDLETHEVPVDEWGGSVMIQELTGEARERLEQLYTDEAREDEPNFRAALCALSIIDDSGELMFNQDDVKALGKKSYKALDRVFVKCKALNGMDDVEEEIKN